jgi:hypothetical protein
MKPIEYLYLDSFRGFEDALIPFRQVTFLLGENSSGKSSVLSALNLVRSFGFWAEADFDTDNQRLGGFADLLTEGSKASLFTIGTARYGENFYEKNPSKIPFAVFASYDNVEGLPRLAKLSFYVHKRATQLKIQGDGVYRCAASFGEINESDTLNETTIRRIAEWHRDTPGSPGEKIKSPEIKRLTAGLLFHLSMIENQRDITDEAQTTPRPDLYSMLHTQRDAVWLAPIRTKPRRTYDGTKKTFSSEGDHTPYLLKKHLSSKTTATRFRELISDLGKDSHLFEDIKIRRFGRDDSSPFEVQVKLGGLALSISNVGYGVSQILPILVEIITRPEKTPFHIQQPEVHLHPRAQAALGDLFYLLAKEEKKSFVIETHSDFLIDRYRQAMSLEENANEAVNTSVVFFCREKSRNKAKELVFSLNGDYPEDQPKGFREFFIQEQMRSLGI